jgi:hypothetical protein
MKLWHLHRQKLALGLAVILSCAPWLSASGETLTREQMKQFLVNAKVMGSKQSKKGITNPWRLTLTDGDVTHDGSFQAVDERKARMEFDDGHIELDFVDSYKYNIAAYALAELLGIDDMLPVYVERKWNGKSGSLSWWLPVKMDEGERLKQKIAAPDPDAWNKQMYRIRVFDELVYDTDPNLTNVLIGEDWKIWRVDFSRSFRLFKELKNPKNLVQCDRQLFANLKTLDSNEVMQRTKNYLSKVEVQSLMARRDKIVAFFEKLISEKGESKVLY